MADIRIYQFWEFKKQKMKMRKITIQNQIYNCQKWMNMGSRIWKKIKNKMKKSRRLGWVKKVRNKRWMSLRAVQRRRRKCLYLPRRVGIFRIIPWIKCKGSRVSLDQVRVNFLRLVSLKIWNLSKQKKLIKR